MTPICPYCYMKQDECICPSEQNLRQQLAESQAREAQLTDIIDRVAQIIAFEGVPYYLLGIEERDEALALPQDDTALRVMFEKGQKYEREECAVVAEKQGEDEPYGHAKFRCYNIAAAIRERGSLK